MKGISFLLLFMVTLLGCENSVSRLNSRRVYSTEPSYPIAPDLLDAIKKINPEHVEKALASGANPNARYSKWGKTALDLIATRTKPRRANGTNDVKQSDVESNIVSILKLLMDAGARVQFRDITILHGPAIHGYPRVTEYLLTKGAAPEGRDRSGLTPIMLAAEYNHPHVMDVLIKYGAKPLSEREIMQIQLCKAANDGEANKLKELLKNGASAKPYMLEHKYDLWLSPLHEAVISMEVELVSILLLNGADANFEHETLYGHGTPLHCVLYNPFSGYSKEKKQIAKLLIDANAHISARNKNEETPLHLASKTNDIEIAKLLIEAGAKLMDRDKDGKTPLDYAESAEMITLLKAHGAKEQ